MEDEKTSLRPGCDNPVVRRSFSARVFAARIILRHDSGHPRFGVGGALLGCSVPSAIIAYGNRQQRRR